MWRNYHLPAVPPRIAPRTRNTIAARNRAMQIITAALGRKFRPMTSSGTVAA